jgi:hypothetical protein
MKATAVNAKLDLLAGISAQLQAPRTKVPGRTTHSSSDTKPPGDPLRAGRTTHPKPMPVSYGRIEARTGGRMEIVLCAVLVGATVSSLGGMAYATLKFALP